MIDSTQALRVFLRVMGTSSLLALPCALMPYDWMNGVHQGLGMGQLPHEPVVGYLARSTSAFYALLGGLLWTASFDLPRHRSILLYLGAAVMALGLLLLAVDHAEGLPRWWATVEGPIDVALGATIFLLARRTRIAPTNA